MKAVKKRQRLVQDLCANLKVWNHVSILHKFTQVPGAKFPPRLYIRRRRIRWWAAGYKFGERTYGTGQLLLQVQATVARLHGFRLHGFELCGVEASRRDLAPQVRLQRRARSCARIGSGYDATCRADEGCGTVVTKPPR